MAVSMSPSNVATTIGGAGHIDDDSGSDYGSDFSAGEEQLVDELLRVAERVPAETAPAAAWPSSASTAAAATTTAAKRARNGQSDAPAWDPTGGSISPRVAQSVDVGDEVDGNRARAVGTSRMQRRPVSSGPVSYPDLSCALSSIEPDCHPPKRKTPTPPPAPPPVEKGSDTRTPLQRFRSYPKRPLTVTDLAAGAWCELQHWYTLTRLPGGRKTVTPAMRGGSRVHQTLEDEVHSTVRVDVASREETFALRLWNIIQGLRTLRDKGITRELEVWGTVEGETLNGVIDQLSHESPNASFEEELNVAISRASTQQPSITDYAGPSHKKVYLTDIKTRGSDRLPTGTALRPARVQLFLYHRLLSDMADDKVDYSAVLERYGLDGNVRFSDAFMAQIGGLHDEIFYDANSDIEETSSDSTPPDLIGYRSISQIIPLLKAELRETFPRGSASIGYLLAVQYRHRSDGHVIGNNSFPNDPEAIDAYVKDNLRWWRGEREPNGVTIEDTHKCGWCEFAETCQWRKDKEAEFLNNRRRVRASVGHVSPNP
ncbi:hypothetical protein F4802DRAFT_597967 [Xylaria palmicola]|nr:hypothetical protein F4802DRAFT_597967 [Xylaria palmicola]